MRTKTPLGYSPCVQLCFSLVVTVGFVIIGGYVMHYLVKMEEESVRKQLGAKVSRQYIPPSMIQFM